jgi:hypothetical protein
MNPDFKWVVWGLLFRKFVGCEELEVELVVLVAVDVSFWALHVLNVMRCGTKAF